jgi:hypothetical protein
MLNQILLLFGIIVSVGIIGIGTCVVVALFNYFSDKWSK